MTTPGMTPRRLAVLASIAIAIPGAPRTAQAQRLQPFAGVGISVGTGGLGCVGARCGGVAPIAGASTLFGGVALGTRVRVGLEYEALSSGGIEICCTKARASLATVSFAPATVPRLELRAAAGRSQVFGRNQYAVTPIASHAFTARAGVGYALGHGDARTLLTVDLLRTRGAAGYGALQFGVAFRAQAERTAAMLPATGRDTSLLPTGTRVRIRVSDASRWQIGQLAASPPGTVRIGACATCQSRTYALEDVRALEQSNGRGRNAGFYGALVGAPLGALIGGAIVLRTYRCPGGWCRFDAFVLGVLGGLVDGGTAGSFAAARWAGERWHPVLLPPLDGR